MSTSQTSFGKPNLNSLDLSNKQHFKNFKRIYLSIYLPKCIINAIISSLITQNCPVSFHRRSSCYKSSMHKLTPEPGTTSKRLEVTSKRLCQTMSCKSSNDGYDPKILKLQTISRNRSRKGPERSACPETLESALCTLSPKGSIKCNCVAVLFSVTSSQGSCQTTSYEFRWHTLFNGLFLCFRCLFSVVVVSPETHVRKTSQ